MSEQENSESVWQESMSIGIQSIDARHKDVAELVKSLDVEPDASITAEGFMTGFSKLQVVIAELFAREEEVIRLIGMPESDKRKHIIEHDRLLGIFNQIYFDSMGHKRTVAQEVYNLLRTEISHHMAEFDIRLRDYVTR